jgi:hypothetical protein
MYLFFYLVLTLLISACSVGKSSIFITGKWVLDEKLTNKYARTYAQTCDYAYQFYPDQQVTITSPSGSKQKGKYKVNDNQTFYVSVDFFQSFIYLYRKEANTITLIHNINNPNVDNQYTTIVHCVYRTFK